MHNIFASSAIAKRPTSAKISFTGIPVILTDTPDICYHFIDIGSTLWNKKEFENIYGKGGDGAP